MKGCDVMEILTCLMTNNVCYKSALPITKGQPYGIVVHATGANNRKISRYVQPTNMTDPIIDILGVNPYQNSWNQTDRKAIVHAFIGADINGKVRTVQTLPYDKCAAGVGTGSKGSFNKNPTACLQFEICQDDDKAYFFACMEEAAQYCAYLRAEFNLPNNKIFSHAEAHALGMAENHGDPEKWMKVYGYDMNKFRARVEEIYQSQYILKPTPEPEKPTTEIRYAVQVGSYKNKSNAQKKLEELKKAGFEGYITIKNVEVKS